ncbi:bile acid:sodium symporter family protein [Kordiimonas gwangyangensis]|uniref:bile acid:sodium symporter family protein n=1 Tax=Kordiimonas gwangyangensis TaxID=288022 RepID=UPI00035F3D40|nr:bile acid:sodium symporter [Kordiimonas gwangyangensis]
MTLDAGAQLGLAISLAFTMFAVALGLKTDDFAFLKSHKRSVAVGLAAQVIGLPLLTLAVLILFNPMPGIALGMLIVACCPGGNVSNLFTRLSRGDTAYSVTLTTCSSIFSAAFLPFMILFWTALYAPTRELVNEIELDRVAFIINTSITLLIPLTLGIWLAHSKPDLATRAQKICLPIAVAIIAVIVIFGIATNASLLTDFGSVILPYVILHNALAFALGALVGRFGLKRPSTRRALVFEIGIQNSGLGLLIMLSQFGGLGSGLLIIATWGVWHFVGGFAVTGLYRLLGVARTPDTLSLQEDTHGL